MSFPLDCLHWDVVQVRERSIDRCSPETLGKHKIPEKKKVATKEESLQKTTHAGAAHSDKEESLHNPSRPDDPCQADEQDDAEDILHTREVDSG